MSNENSANNDPLHNLDELLEKAEDYTEEKINLLKLKAARHTANMASGLAFSLLFYSILVMAIILLNIGLALWVGQWLNNSVYGFFILAAVYLLLAFILKAFRKPQIENGIKNNIIQKIFSGNGMQDN